ncbi:MULTISPECIES: hypothetical protein [unclassified Curtobacterium]|uniref:hypothetical protein n=1 Tax=unclassified Curtobacterium TaxID=257496 RepID=UPI003A802362
MALTKGFIQTAATTPLDARFFSAANVVRNPDNTVRTGLLFGDFNPVAKTTSMNVTIADQTVYVLSRSLSDGATIVTNVGVATVAIPTAPSSNSQYSVVYVKHNDTSFGDADSNPLFGVVTGTAAASPAVPAVPSGAVAIATVLVPAGATTTSSSGVVITNIIKGTSTYGSAIRYRTVSDMRADVANVLDGCLAYIKGDALYYLRGGVFRRLDSNVFVHVAQVGGPTQGTATSPGTLGGTPQSYQVSDTQFFDVRTDGVVGPAKVAGWYEATANVTWGSNTSGERFIEITNNDTSQNPPIADRRPAATTNVGTTSSSSATGQLYQSVSGPIYLNVGEFIKLKGWQNSGSSIAYNSRLLVKLMSV